MKKFAFVLIILSFLVLLLSNLYVNAFDKSLYSLAARGKTQALEKKLLIDNQLDKNPDEIFFALSMSLQKNQAGSFEILLNHIDKNNLEISIPLSQLPASDDFLEILFNKMDNTTLFIDALKSQRFDIAKIILEREMELDLEKLNALEAIDTDLSDVQSTVNFLVLSAYYEDEYESMMYDVLYVVSEILEMDISLNKFIDPRSLITFCIDTNNYIGTKNYELLELLIREGYTDHLSYGLPRAASSRDTQLIKYLVENGATLDGEFGAEALLAYNDIDVIKTFIDLGIELTDDKINNVVNNILYKSVFYGEKEIIELFLTNGIDVNRPLRDSNQTMILLATETLNPEIVEFLLKNGASVDDSFIKTADYIIRDIKNNKLDWFDIGNKRKCDEILNMLSE
ncbi:hypothetical protein RBH29_15200 [Herbivorax sp. ANBcel31]|uniref:ankyrin repeat domain-containing protein n=1 Tax=Herbivorax sp. ANBcel31 TaxID=3069754 RepID=UPI0027B6DB59|nr:ankyrin repeat domain-containing protein [Herbivorax sp. ANBcel31]MDQ2087776.1 hypothetical protein [Herbivorax sp. ANBcel31]